MPKLTIEVELEVHEDLDEQDLVDKIAEKVEDLNNEQIKVTDVYLTGTY